MDQNLIIHDLKYYKYNITIFFYICYSMNSKNSYKLTSTKFKIDGEDIL